jgi:DNA-binding transcriptional LysR family regulator
MELRHLEIFCKVVEHGSFSKAAVALSLTQPTVSIHLKALEDSVGTRLLDRLGRSITPTRAGEILYKYAKEIVRYKAEAEGALNEFSGSMRGPLTVGASNIPGEYILPSYISRFKERFPEIVPAIRIGDSQSIYNLVLEAGVDVGVVGFEIKDRNIVSRKFLDDELFLVASAKFKRDEVSTEDLKTLPLLLRETGSGSTATVLDSLTASGIDTTDLNLVGDMGSTRALIEAVKSGMGLAFISGRAVNDDIKHGTLKQVNVNGIVLKRKFDIITHRLRADSPICKAFIEFLSEKT